MIANIRNFGNMDMNEANRELKENLNSCFYLQQGMQQNIRIN